MYRRLIPLILVSVALTCGCGTDNNSSSQQSSTLPPAPVPASTLKVALLTTGPVTDGGWNQSAWEGVQQIQTELGATVAKQENLKDSEFEDAFRDFANKGFNLIIGHGDEFSDAAAKVAVQYPNVDFVTTGGDKSAPNLMPIHFRTEEGNYLQGMEAAMISKTGKGGFIGGMALPPVALAAKAFQKGALAVNPHFKYQITYINSWTDPAAAKSQTLTLLNNGCDVLSHNCDAAAKGMFDTAATKPGVFTFGVNANENNKAPNVFSSAVLDIPKAFTDIATDVRDHKFKGGPESLGMSDGDVVLIDNTSFPNVLTTDQHAKVEAAKHDILTGKLQVSK